MAPQSSMPTLEEEVLTLVVAASITSKTSRPPRTRSEAYAFTLRDPKPSLPWPLDFPLHGLAFHPGLRIRHHALLALGVVHVRSKVPEVTLSASVTSRVLSIRAFTSEVIASTQEALASHRIIGW